MAKSTRKNAVKENCKAQRRVSTRRTAARRSRRSAPSNDWAVGSASTIVDPIVSKKLLEKIKWSLYTENDRQIIRIAVGFINTATAVICKTTPFEDVVWWMDYELTDVWGSINPSDPFLSVLLSMVPSARDFMWVYHFHIHPREIISDAELLKKYTSVISPFHPSAGGGRNKYEKRILKPVPGHIAMAHEVAMSDTPEPVSKETLLRALACKLYVVGCQVVMRAVEGKSLMKRTDTWLHPDLRQGMHRLAGLECGVGQMPEA